MLPAPADATPSLHFPKPRLAKKPAPPAVWIFVVHARVLAFSMKAKSGLERYRPDCTLTNRALGKLPKAEFLEGWNARRLMPASHNVFGSPRSSKLSSSRNVDVLSHSGFIWDPGYGLRSTSYTTRGEEVSGPSSPWRCTSLGPGAAQYCSRLLRLHKIFPQVLGFRVSQSQARVGGGSSFPVSNSELFLCLWLGLLQANN